MTPPRTSEAEHARRLAIIERHRGTGFGWLKRAADESGINPTTFRRWANNAGIKATETVPVAGEPLPPIAPPVERVPEEPLAERQKRKLLDEQQRLRRELSQAHRELNDAEDLRGAIFGLGKAIDPASHHINPSAADSEAEVPLLFQSDEQWGEVIDL